jgi:predicted nucleotidyltransferase
MLTKLPRSSIHKDLLELKKDNLIDGNNKIINNIIAKTMKTNFFIEKIIKSGLIEDIISRINPSCIILFGSIRKGESNNESDIDLFIETDLKKELNLKEFERKLGHKIQLFIERDINKLQPNLLNNVVNGIKLYGSFKIKTRKALKS